MTTRAPQHGFSLVELMIAMVLGLLLLAAVGGMFLANKRSDRENRIIAEMQLNGRFALEALSHDLSMAGFLGGMPHGTLISQDSSTAVLYAGCDPKTKNTTDNPNTWMALTFRNNVGTGSALSGSCLANVNIATVTDLDGAAHGTDVLIIHRTAGKPTFRYQQTKKKQTPSLRSDTIYLRTNRTVGSLCINGNTNASCTGENAPDTWPTTFWEYQTFAYFIKGGDGTPTLCRRYLAVNTAKHTPYWDTECVADGVADLQITFGVDTDGDNVANRYMTNPDAGQLANAVSARIQLLMRAPRSDPQLGNDNCYTLQAAVAKPREDCFKDHYYRRIMQTTVLLRNLQ